MDREEQKSSRPKFLRHEPGVIDVVYNAWCKAADGLKGLLQNKNNSSVTATFGSATRSPAPIPHYVEFFDDNVICVQNKIKTDLIEPFCTYNNIKADHLYIAVTREGCAGLKRDVLEALLTEATDIFKHHRSNYMGSAFARELMDSFKFLKGASAKEGIVPISDKSVPPYKIAPPWERHHN